MYLAGRLANRGGRRGYNYGLAAAGLAQPDISRVEVLPLRHVHRVVHVRCVLGELQHRGDRVDRRFLHDLHVGLSPELVGLGLGGLAQRLLDQVVDGGAGEVAEVAAAVGREPARARVQRVEVAYRGVTVPVRTPAGSRDIPGALVGGRRGALGVRDVQVLAVEVR